MSNDKVIIRLKAIGNAPILKQQIFKLSSNNKFSKILSFIKKELQSNDLYVYVNNFIPSPEDSIEDLNRLFGTDGSLLLNYSIQPAYG